MLFLSVTVNASSNHHMYSLIFQQWRLIPYLAAAYALEHFSKSIFLHFVEFQIGQMMKDKTDRQVRKYAALLVCLHLWRDRTTVVLRVVLIFVFKAEMSKEIHALGCSSKPLSSWLAQRGIQECREACGGHGYLASQSHGRCSHMHACTRTLALNFIFFLF